MPLFPRLRSLGGADLDPFIAPQFHAEFEADPVVVYDVGASVELMSPLPLSNEGKARVIGFEPVEISYQALIRKYKGFPDVEIRQLALADITGTVAFNIYDAALTTSSLLTRTSHVWRSEITARQVEANAVRLDDAPSTLNLPPPNFLKLDTEGSELMILSHGPKMLTRHIIGMFSEFTFMEIAESGTKFHDLDRQIYQHDFVLFDIQVSRTDKNRLGGKKGPCTTGDALYLKNFFKYYDTVQKSEDPGFIRAQALKMIAICLGFRYVTYALEVAYFMFKEGYFEPHEYNLIYDQLASITNLSESLPDFPGRLRLAHLFDFLAHLMYTGETKGSPVMSNAIGNRKLSLLRRAAPDAVKPGYLLREHSGGGSRDFVIRREPN